VSFGKEYTVIYSHSILITDDDRSLRETLRCVFEPRGYRTWLAGDGEEALKILHNEAVDLLLLDMHMPKLTGLEVLRLVKQWKSRLPCILMSADADEDLIQQARREQAYSVLRKPVSRQRITSLVEEAIETAYPGRIDVPPRSGLS
jgi:CheY-like chemotaxis protein